MKLRLSWLFVLALGMSVIVACGDDDDVSKDGGNEVEDAGKADSGASVGNGTGGNGSATGSGGATAISVECGSATCTGSAATGAFIMPCCADEATNTCGTSVGGGACNVAPPKDPDCKSVSLAGVINLAGCCAAGNECGLDGSMIGQGCVPLDQAAQLMPLLMGLITIPEPTTCDGEPIEMEDAGTQSNDTDAGQ